MKRVTRQFGVVILIVAFFLLTFGSGHPAIAGSAGYVVLGDSIEYGLGASNRTVTAYVPMFFAYLESAVFVTPADLTNLGTPGATTKDILQNELLPAIAAIQTHSPVVVSWGGGGNDLLDFIESPQAHACLQVPSCLSRLNALLDEAQQNIDLTIKALRFFAGDSPILMRTQYNSLRRTGCATPDRVALADAAIEGIVPGTLLANNGLNDRIRAVAVKYGAIVVEGIFEQFAANPDGLVAADCIHPNDAGHAVIRDAFILAIP